MFCVHCGAEGAARFCPACGRRQSLADSETTTTARPQLHQPEADETIVEALLVESDSIRYEEILADAQARERIATAGRGAIQGVTSEDLLAVFDAVSPIGISLGKLTTAIMPIYDKLGIKTSRHSQAIFDAPPRSVMLAVLCTLAAKGMVVKEVHQDVDKCSLITDIPPGLITNRGQMVVLIAVTEQYVQVSFATTISGQWYDWGKSERMMDDLFASIRADLTDQHHGQQPKFRRVA